MTDSPPRFLRMDAKTLFITLCISNIIGDVFEIFNGRHFQLLVWTSCILEVMTLIGVLTNNVTCLKRTVFFALINIIFYGVLIFIVPISMAAIFASGYNQAPVQIWTAEGFYRTTPQEEIDARLALGLLYGFAAELGMAFLLLVSYAKYILVKRIYVYAKDTNAPTPVYTSV
ncbi:unnamed protein product [Caenorhabditis angaria]|uniref:Uncharacterized protein n=1 Tax=Caenorhabditis angaria TaxID=860376 RepID=A0A9P1J042_9PELO|nr:unnamed protein product [Caenorhabditis angaria]